MTDIDLGPTMRSISLEMPEMAKKKGSNRYYDEEFKQDVLRLVDGGRPIVEWLKAWDCAPASSTNGTGRENVKWGQ